MFIFKLPVEEEGINNNMSDDRGANTFAHDSVCEETPFFLTLSSVLVLGS